MRKAIFSIFLLMSIILLYGIGQTFLAILLLIGFIIPFSMIVYAYFRNQKKNKS